MQLQQAVHNVFTQLSASLQGLSDTQYTAPCVNLSNATIGQHVRHIIEMFQCLELGYEHGIVNYEKRKRDRDIETGRAHAINLLRAIGERLNRSDRVLVLEGVYNDDATEPMQFPTNYYREVVYNLEHTIHHMALIRVGLKEISNMSLPEGYGLASATVKHNRECAQ